MENRNPLSITLGEAGNIVKYFNATIVGSVLFELNGLLDFNLVNDVDVAIDQDLLFNVRDYLEDKGFKETKRTYKQRGYADFIGSLIFEKENHLPIHLLLKPKEFVLKTVSEIVKEKFERYSESDRIQLLNILKNKLPIAK